MSYRVLIACEESQSECKAFRSFGCEAFFCDLQKCSGGHPEWHIRGDVLDILYDDWDLIIAHPPCTYLALSGSCHYGRLGQEDRPLLCSAARDFFLKFYDLGLSGHKVVIENPVPAARSLLPPWSQVIQPYYFGEPFSKQTCLWLLNVPPLVSTCICEDFISFTSIHRTSRQRSKSFDGVSFAMAQQWSFLL